MRATEKGTARRTFTKNGDRIADETPASDGNVDFSVFGAKEIRDLLRNKAHCLRAGFSSNHIIIKTFNEIRDHYILRVGLATYLSQMLGQLATVQMRYCTLYTESFRRIETNLSGKQNQQVQRFIAKHFEWDKLPFKVEVRGESNPDQVQIRYL